jgi:prepilin-type N-terminal cleavage/methylation domain-containing protein
MIPGLRASHRLFACRPARVSTASSARRGFTLVEVMVTVTVLAIIGSVTLPILHGATVNYGEMRRAQRASGHLVYAIDRVVRVLRELDEDPETGALALESLSPTAIRATEGPVIELQSGLLTMTEPGGAARAICDHIELFEVRYLDDAGAQTNDPAAVHVVEVSVVRDGFTLTTRAFPRIRAAS